MDPRIDGAARRFEKFAAAARGPLAVAVAARNDGLARRLWGEVVEAAGEVATTIRGGWRMPESELRARIDHLLSSKNLNEYGVDPFGFSPAYVERVIPAMELLYRLWFRPDVHDIERVPADGRLLMVANHSGQLPFDGAVIGSSLLLDLDPPRMIRSMVEKFATALPFFGDFCVRCGQVTGLPENCRRLLEREECVLVFPEGAHGISKPFSQRYQLTRFGHGFMRLALETGTPILPVAVVGAEEQIINLGNFALLARLVGAPSVPLPPLALLIGPLAMVPMPVKYRLYFGEPMHFDGDPNDDDAVISLKVGEVRGAIDAMIQRGLRERKGIFI